MAFAEGIEFAIGAKRIAPLWRLLSGLSEQEWSDAIGMDAAQVAVASYRPDWWPARTEILIRRVNNTSSISPKSPPIPGHGGAAPCTPSSGPCPSVSWRKLVRSTRIRLSAPTSTCPPAAKAVEVEHWYRQRTTIENLFRDSKHGGALRHLPSGYKEINTAWMHGALLAADIAAWLHQLTATSKRDGDGGETVTGHGIRGGKAMITILRHRLINIPARLISHAGQTILRLPPGHDLLAEILARLRALPVT